MRRATVGALCFGLACFAGLLPASLDHTSQNVAEARAGEMDGLPKIPSASPIGNHLLVVHLGPDAPRCDDCAFTLELPTGPPRVADVERAARESAPRPIRDILRGRREAYRISGQAEPLEVLILASERTPLLEVGEAVARLRSLDVEHVVLGSASHDGELRGVRISAERDDVRYLPNYCAFTGEGCCLAPSHLRLEVIMGSIDLLAERRHIAAGCSTTGEGPAIPPTPEGGVDLVALKRCMGAFWRQNPQRFGLAVVAEPWMRVRDFAELLTASLEPGPVWNVKVLLPPGPAAAR